MSSENYHGKKVAVFHIGTMKVGTTSIQSFLRANKETIRDRDGIYWLADYIRQPDRLTALMKEAGATGKSIVICDEGLWHHAFERADLQGMKDALPGYDFRAIMYVRKPADFLESWYLQGVKSGKGEPLFGNFTNHSFVRRGLNFKERMPSVASIFGGITIRAYERSQLKNGDAVSDFLDFVGIDEDGLQRPPAENVTPDPNVLMMARITKELAMPSHAEAIRKIANNIGRSGKSSILYPRDIRDIERRYSGQIEWLHENYGVPGRKSFFDPTEKRPSSGRQTLRPVYDWIMEKLASQ